MSKGPSDSTLNRWWRLAVLTVNGSRCFFCRRFIGEEDPWESHHVVKRKHRVLRYDPQNGVPTCPECHVPVGHGLKGALIMAERLDSETAEYLVEKSSVLFKDALKDEGLSEKEWRERELALLKSIVKSGRR